MLDFPDDIGFPATPAHSTATQTFLVTNAGAAHAAFVLEAAPPFAVRPAAGELVPGEVLRCCADFRPATAGARPLPCSPGHALGHSHRSALERDVARAAYSACA